MNTLFILLALSKQESIIYSFAFVAAFFLILLIIGVRKTARLKDENRKLMETIDLNIKDTDYDKNNNSAE